MFYYDTKTNKYQGWYVDLYKDDKGEIDFGLNIYLHNYYIKKSINYINMNYPEIGLIAVKNQKHKAKKLFVMSYYSGKENINEKYSVEMNYDKLILDIINRK